MTLSDVKMYLFGITVFAWIFERIASALGWMPVFTNILTWIVIVSWLILVIVNLIFLRPRKRYQWLMVFGFGAGGGMAIATLMIWSKASAWEPALTWCSVVSVLGVILGFWMRSLYRRECREILAKNYKRSQQRRREKALGR